MVGLITVNSTGKRGGREGWREERFVNKGEKWGGVRWREGNIGIYEERE